MIVSMQKVLNYANIQQDFKAMEPDLNLSIYKYLFEEIQ